MITPGPGFTNSADFLNPPDGSGPAPCPGRDSETPSQAASGPSMTVTLASSAGGPAAGAPGSFIKLPALRLQRSLFRPARGPRTGKYLPSHGSGSHAECVSPLAPVYRWLPYRAVRVGVDRLFPSSACLFRAVSGLRQFGSCAVTHMTSTRT